MGTFLEVQLSLLKEKQDALHLSPDAKHVSDTVVEVTDDYSSNEVLQDERDIVTHVLSVEDDPSLTPWTLRAFVIGIALSAFAGALGKYLTGALDLFTQCFSTAEIYYFKPVSTPVKLAAMCEPLFVNITEISNRSLSPLWSLVSSATSLEW
jgi:hypothetical protein